MTSALIQRHCVHTRADLIPCNSRGPNGPQRSPVSAAFRCFPSASRSLSSQNLSPSQPQKSSAHPARVVASDAQVTLDSGGGGGEDGKGGEGGGGGGGEGGGQGEGADKSPSNPFSFLLDVIFKGWRERVQADPQFAYKVLVEQVIGVTACVLGDMASRPNFGLNELDFVFSTLVVGSILNFMLMYLLAPVASSTALPGVFSACPDGHMFQPGSYHFFHRAGTFVYKGVQFGVVGFAAGVVGTVISNVLLETRKKMDPTFVSQNEAPPTVLNASTWALHLGVSSNLRYQALNGLDLFLAQALPPTIFKPLVFFIRGANNVIGGASFAVLARATGAQKAAASSPSKPIATQESNEATATS